MVNALSGILVGVVSGASLDAKVFGEIVRNAS